MSVRRRPRAAPARPPGRGLGRRRGPPGLPAGAADPRAAHPPRQGDLQHLHRPGAAGRRRLDVRRLPRPRRPAGDRDPHPPLRRRARRGARGAAASRWSTTTFFDTLTVRGARAAPPRSSPRPARTGCTCASSTPTTSASRPRRPPRRSHARQRAAGLRRVGADRRRPRRGSRRRAARRRCAARRRTSPTRCSPATTARPQMLRYLRRLSARDYALDRGMIPLGSCTMKLNATTEMEPVSLPGFADLHPFAPAEDAAGYRRAGRRPRGLAGRGHRLRPGLDPAQRRLAGRARRAAGDPRLPPRQRRHRARTSA